MKSIAPATENIQAAAQFAEEELRAFLRPLWALYPDKRLQRSVTGMVKGLITAQTPHISKAMHVGDSEPTPWPGPVGEL